MIQRFSFFIFFRNSNKSTCPFLSMKNFKMNKYEKEVFSLINETLELNTISTCALKKRILEMKNLLFQEEKETMKRINKLKTDVSIFNKID